MLNLGGDPDLRGGRSLLFHPLGAFIGVIVAPGSGGKTCSKLGTPEP